MEWLVLKNRRHEGPYNEAVLRKALVEGRLTPDDYAIPLKDAETHPLNYVTLKKILALPEAPPPEPKTSPEAYMKTEPRKTASPTLKPVIQKTVVVPRESKTIERVVEEPYTPPSAPGGGFPWRMAFAVGAVGVGLFVWKMGSVGSSAVTREPSAITKGKRKSSAKIDANAPASSLSSSSSSSLKLPNTQEARLKHEQASESPPPVDAAAASALDPARAAAQTQAIVPGEPLPVSESPPPLPSPDNPYPQPASQSDANNDGLNAEMQRQQYELYQQQLQQSSALPSGYPQGADAPVPAVPPPTPPVGPGPR